MEEEELGGSSFLISVDELGQAGLWASVKEVRRTQAAEGRI